MENTLPGSGRGPDYWAGLGAVLAVASNPVTKRKEEKKKAVSSLFPGLLHVRTTVFLDIAIQHPQGPGREDGALTALVSQVPPGLKATGRYQTPSGALSLSSAVKED